jgi:hypothetical protein
MKPLIALLILGSIATSAPAAGTDIHGLVDGETGKTVVSEQLHSISRPMISGTFSRYRSFGRDGASFGGW